jgi:hypothetical protein
VLPARTAKSYGKRRPALTSTAEQLHKFKHRRAQPHHPQPSAILAAVLGGYSPVEFRYQNGAEDPDARGGWGTVASKWIHRIREEVP